MNKFKNIYEYVNYSTKLPYISNIITEYDLSKANISALKSIGAIDDEYYNRLYYMPKSLREVTIGRDIKQNPEIYNYIRKGIIEAKKRFFEINNIRNEEVVCIKNDAIFIVGTRPIQCNVGEYFKFVPKHTYTFYMITINRMQFFYNYNPVDGSEDLEIKGIKDDQFKFHMNHMIDFICTIFQMIQTCTIDDTMKVFNEFYENFINLRLPAGYYRELNAISKFKLLNNYILDYIDDKHVKQLDIQNNLYILRDIFSILSDMYFSKTNNGRR